MTDIQELLSQLQGVKSSGAGYTSQCPAHEDNRNSLSITESDGKILLYCHAGCETEAICQSLNLSVKDLFADSKPTGKPVIVKTYDYQEPDGTLRYQVCRYKPKDFRQRRPDGSGGWIYNLKDTKPIIYNLPEVIKAAQRKGSLIIVEGEKDVETLRELKITATCNSGGAGKFPPNCAGYFAGMRVCIIPDNDEPGAKHALKVANLLHGTATEIRILNLPDMQEHGDVSDYLTTHTKDELIKLIKGCEKWNHSAPEPEVIKPVERPACEPENTPFRLLGYNSGCYYYLPGEDLQIINLTAEAHTQSQLISLAPLTWWEATFPDKYGANWNKARNYLFRQSKRVGIYDSRNLRGCGTWFDDNRVVQHNGDHLVVDGEHVQINDFKTKYIYNASFPIEVLKAEPISRDEAAALLALCRKPTWEKKISGTLMAGWCVIAPICGALPWRPHIWLTGASGTGKTYIIDQIIKQLLGSLALCVQSNTTEAGIRQMLGINAFPVVFDESEGEDMQSRKRLQAVLELMRQASTEAGAPIIKGGQSGRAIEFRVRSCFCMSSIGVNINQKADASRITVLSLRKQHPDDTVDFFDELKADLFKLITPDFPARLRTRTLKLIPVIIGNYKVFSRAVAERFHDQRIGDQFGALLAGAYSLVSNHIITHDKAIAFIDEQDWTEQSAIEDLPDELKCLNKILEHVINYTSDYNRIEKGIGEIVYNSIHEGLTLDAENALSRVGIRIIGEQFNRYLVISDSHKGIKKILLNEPWEQNWGRILKRLPESEAKTTCRFNGIIQRATQIPFSIIFGDNE